MTQLPPWAFLRLALSETAKHPECGHFDHQGRDNSCKKPPHWCASFSRCAVLAVAALAVTTTALARDNGQWGNQPEEIRAWFQSVMQPGNPYQSCCGEADAFEVEMAGDGPDGSFVVRVLSGPDAELIGQLIDVPRSKLQTKYGNPLDKFILFLGSGGRIYCLIPKVGA